MAQRVTQDASLALAQGSPAARVSQDASLTLAPGSPNARVSQFTVLTLMAVALTPTGTEGGIIFVST